MTRKHTCPADPKKIVGFYLPLFESRPVDEPRTGILQANFESSVIIGRWDKTRQPLVDLV
jgi:hypothetical protein